MSWTNTWNELKQKTDLIGKTLRVVLNEQPESLGKGLYSVKLRMEENGKDTIIDTTLTRRDITDIIHAKGAFTFEQSGQWANIKPLGKP